VSSPLDRFVEEIRAARGDFIARCFAVVVERLQNSTDLGAIDLHDEMTEIVSRRAPLRDRMAEILRIKE
jgi:hypothetical protein